MDTRENCTSNRRTSNHAQQQEDWLVAAAKNGDHSAYSELCRRHTAMAFRTVRRITRNTEDAEDAVQESLMRAFAHLHNFDGRSAFSSWLTRIAINAALMILRKRRCHLECSLDMTTDDGLPRELDVVEPSFNPEDACIHNERNRHVTYAVGRLAPKLKGVMQIQVEREARIEEIAAAAGISKAAAKSRLLRARRAMRVSLDRLQRGIPSSQPAPASARYV
ncbi:MAG TPA: sigma-70 family RNA polymerase sigma factor [Acidobacteriaceae bacterium]|jgi:RNA polymerase sigma-70 factor (ECF subfamily)|nr:sigma-70 family RNA polymerase sigma factor [Acidobacteriaceae bacterium]